MTTTTTTAPTSPAPPEPWTDRVSAVEHLRSRAHILGSRTDDHELFGYGLMDVAAGLCAKAAEDARRRADAEFRRECRAIGADPDDRANRLVALLAGWDDIVEDRAEEAAHEVWRWLIPTLRGFGLDVTDED
jgi:hypothetical protein